MKKKIKNLCIIPARIGSKRIKNKNIKSFFGKPIIEIAIKNIKQTGLFQDIYVSTDSTKISKIAKKLGTKIHFRKRNLCKDNVGTLKVVNSVVKDLEKGLNFEKVCCIYPTSIFFTKKDLRDGFTKLKKNLDYVVSAAKFDHPIERSFKLNKKKIITGFQLKNNKNTQYFDKSYHDAAQFYIGWKKSWIKKKKFFNSRTKIIDFSNKIFQDIDDISDWNNAKIKWKIIKIKKNN